MGKNQFRPVESLGVCGKIAAMRRIGMKTAVLITGLLLLLAANVLMVYYSPYGFAREGFQAVPNAPVPNAPPAAPAPMPNVPGANGLMPNGSIPNSTQVEEGFSSYFLENAGGAKELYAPMGAYDGVKLPTGNGVSQWRYTAPNEKLMGAEFQPGPDALFMFKNNQCKPECCGASFSCGGGCVCTTPQQRQYIASRGGNRTAPEDSA